MADAGSGTVPTTFADAVEIDLSTIPRCGKKALMTVRTRIGSLPLAPALGQRPRCSCAIGPRCGVGSRFARGGGGGGGGQAMRGLRLPCGFLEHGPRQSRSSATPSVWSSCFLLPSPAGHHRPGRLVPGGAPAFQGGLPAPARASARGKNCSRDAAVGQRWASFGRHPRL